MFGREEDYVESIQPDKSLAVYLCTCLELKATLQRLLEEKNSPNLYAPSGENYSSFGVAVWYGNINMLDMLSGAGGDSNTQDK
jgi:hypothetical protein